VPLPQIFPTAFRLLFSGWLFSWMGAGGEIVFYYFLDWRPTGKSISKIGKQGIDATRRYGEPPTVRNGGIGIGRRGIASYAETCGSKNPYRASSVPGAVAGAPSGRHQPQGPKKHLHRLQPGKIVDTHGLDHLNLSSRNF